MITCIACINTSQRKIVNKSGHNMDFFFYNNVYTKLKTNVKKTCKHRTVPRRQYAVCLEEKLKCKNP